MMPRQRSAAESLLVHQHCGLHTDTDTFRRATIIAHHGDRFVYATAFQKYFADLSDSWRRAVPLCPCACCVNKRNRAAGSFSGEVSGQQQARNDTTATQGAPGT